LPDISYAAGAGDPGRTRAEASHQGGAPPHHPPYHPPHHPPHRAAACPGRGTARAARIGVLHADPAHRRDVAPARCPVLPATPPQPLSRPAERKGGAHGALPGDASLLTGGRCPPPDEGSDPWSATGLRPAPSGETGADPGRQAARQVAPWRCSDPVSAPPVPLARPIARFARQGPAVTRPDRRITPAPKGWPLDPRAPPDLQGA
jgi:hypothetical protein